MDKCDESMDIIVMPEACDAPCYSGSRENRAYNYAHFNKALLEKASQTAKRCSAILFTNANFETEQGMRNATYAFDRSGKLCGKYFKQHLTPGEMNYRDGDYTLDFEEPTVIEIEGIRFAFLTCYDFYFYESFANIARYGVDIIIGCSHQRSDMHSAIETIGKFLSYNTNTYLLRASVSMKEDSEIGGCSMIVSPRGEILCNMKSSVGIACADIDINDKYYKPAGFNNPLAAHYEYIEAGRRPWKYRPAGSAIARNDACMKFPRLCASGYGCGLPKNSMASFGAAVAENADEIAFGILEASDGILYVSDNGSTESTLTLEALLKKLACHAVMNIRISEQLSCKKLAAILKKYDCEKYVYFTSDDDDLIASLGSELPYIPRCLAFDGVPNPEEAKRLGCTRIEIKAEFATEENIKSIHDAGSRCVCASGNAEKLFALGADCVITEDFSSAVCLKNI